MQARFSDRLNCEYRARRVRNRRYSLRAFGAFLGVDHSTLSQVMRDARRASTAHIQTWGAKLGIDEEEIRFYSAVEGTRIPRSEGKERHEHWTMEAAPFISGSVHWEIVRLNRDLENFRADSRWLAGQLHVSIDEINLALSRLLRLGLLEINARGSWREATGLSVLTEPAFRNVALRRVREKADEHEKSGSRGE
ncbi:MAG TPA: hypothetical protein VKZ53_06135 [Candidatus Angelobacter sp.]|nr:hypothetical protein [Candidatus Angelobacter sp.]